MEKTAARKVIHRFAKACKCYGYTQADWDYKEESMFSLMMKPEIIPKAYSLVGPEIWEHVGYWVWQPMRRDR